MLGAFRLLKKDGASGGFYELFAIGEFEGSLRFVIAMRGKDAAPCTEVLRFRRRPI